MSLLSVDLPRKQFGGKRVLQNIHLRVDAGEVVMLVGASGCGKSTLLRVVAGLDRAHDGEVRLGDRRLDGPTPEVRFVFQEPRLFPWLTVAQNVAFDLGHDHPAHPRALELLREVGLEGHAAALPKQLSGGQAQRVAIERGLFARPSLLLLDEPFSAVDAFTRIKLQDLLLQLARTRGVTVLMVTHDIDEAVQLGDRVLVMRSDPGAVHEDLAVGLPRGGRRANPDTAAVAARVRQALQDVHAF